MSLSKERTVNFTNELLDCPFCGYRPKLDFKVRGFHYGKSTKVSQIYCPNCHCRSGKVHNEDYASTSDVLNALKSLWNNRK